MLTTREHVQIGLAHWCETHGPTSILCTQVLAPSCTSCNPPLTRSPSTPQLGLLGGLTPPQSSHGRAATTANTPISSPTPRASSSRLPSPSETPPASPRSPILGPTSALSGSAGSLPEQCRNCAITLPSRFDADDRPPTSVRGASPPGRPLRTTEAVAVEGAGGASHTHTVTYHSARSPAQAARYSHVRQACIRSLSCELVPAQTGPILFGDGTAGYTIAVVFKLADAKSRGGLRTYALLCMSQNQRALMQSWNVIASVFQNLVHQIQHAVAEKAARDAAAGASAASAAAGPASRPEGFLRRRAPGDAAAVKSLADLVGNDRFYVDLHSAFVHLLAGLAKAYGYSGASDAAAVAP